jgi:hypothetical protein
VGATGAGGGGEGVARPPASCLTAAAHNTSAARQPPPASISAYPGRQAARPPAPLPRSRTRAAAASWAARLRSEAQRQGLPQLRAWQQQQQQQQQQQKELELGRATEPQARGCLWLTVRQIQWARRRCAARRATRPASPASRASDTKWRTVLGLEIRYRISELELKLAIAQRNAQRLVTG